MDNGDLLIDSVLENSLFSVVKTKDLFRGPYKSFTFIIVLALPWLCLNNLPKPVFLLVSTLFKVLILESTSLEIETSVCLRGRNLVLTWFLTSLSLMQTGGSFSSYMASISGCIIFYPGKNAK